jgi:hypothetical protein
LGANDPHEVSICKPTGVAELGYASYITHEQARPGSQMGRSSKQSSEAVEELLLVGLVDSRRRAELRMSQTFRLSDHALGHGNSRQGQHESRVLLPCEPFMQASRLIPSSRPGWVLSSSWRRPLADELRHKAGSPIVGSVNSLCRSRRIVSTAI